MPSYKSQMEMPIWAVFEGRDDLIATIRAPDHAIAERKLDQFLHKPGRRLSYIGEWEKKKMADVIQFPALSPEAKRLIAALIAPEFELNDIGVEGHKAVFAPTEVWEEIAKAFPLSLVDAYVNGSEIYVEHENPERDTDQAQT